MARWIIDRLLQTVVVLIFATVLGFLLVRLLKGSETFALLGDNYTRQAADALSRQLGLNKPLPLQYLSWLGDAVRGNFGTSAITQQAIGPTLLAALGPTVELLIGGQLVSLLLTFLLTTVSVRWRWTDRLVTGFALLCSSVPSFVVGLLAIIVFSSTLHALPAIAWASPSTAGWGTNLKGMIMPSIALGISVFPNYLRVLRSQVDDQLDNEEYVTLARMKGLSGRRVLGRHVVPNSLSGLITLVALTTGFLISGVVIVEQVFGIPGEGSLVYNAIAKRDATMLEGAILLIAVAVVVFNLIGELAQMWLDPRVRVQ
ncbi:MAG TPA: ABC transporter permease [Trebonia sp.]|jgi:peptide/nickel transport system permease protein|nr:ABC transporter permease [Trebonia sp.]